MACFGVIVSPGECALAYTLPTAPGAAGRLHLTRVSLDDDGSDDYKTVTVRVTLGEKIPIIIARLLPRHTESLHLDLRYNLSHEVTFSVLGPRRVHLAGYYAGLPDSADSESFGEDILQSDSDELSGDDDEYGGSFINDSDPGFSSPNSANSSFEANGHPDDQKTKPIVGKSSRRQLRKVHVVEFNTDSSGTSEGGGIEEVVPDSDDDFEFYENSLLTRKLRANSSVEGAVKKNVPADQELTRSSERVSDMAKNSVVPVTKGLAASSPPKQLAKMKESKDGSTIANSRTPLENGTIAGDIRHITVENDHVAGKAASPRQVKAETASESVTKKKKKCLKKEDPSQNNVNEQRHEAVIPEPVTPGPPQTSKDADLGLKVSKKKKKLLKDKLGGMDEPAKVQASGVPNALDDEKQLAGVKFLKAGEPVVDAVLQVNESVKVNVLRSKKGKRKKSEENDALAPQPTVPLPTPAQALPTKTEDNSKKEKKKQREK